MAKHFKKNKSTKPLEIHSSSVKPQKLKFSFEYYDNSNDRFCLSRFNRIQLRNALLRLKDVSTKTFDELRREKRIYHFGEVIWEKTIFPKGFPNQATKLLSAFHFALLGVNEQLCRVYGAYYMDTFYIIWFDLNHEIWPTPLKNT